MQTSYFLCLHHVIRHEKSHSAALRQTAGDAAAVADQVHSLGNFKVAVVHGADGIVFILTAIQQGVVVRRAGRDLIERINGLDDVGERTVGHHHRQIARKCLQGRNDGVRRQAVIVRASAAHQVAEALHHHIALRGKVGVLGDILGIFRRLVEVARKVDGRKNGKVAVLRLLLRLCSFWTRQPPPSTHAPRALSLGLVPRSSRSQDRLLCMA